MNGSVEVIVSTSSPAGAAHPERSPVTPLDGALAAAAAATTLVALWLGFTAFTVLPARDPAHVPMWLGVASGFLVFAAASFAALRPGRFGRVGRVAAALLGVAAAGLGLGTVLRVGLRTGAHEHFEGYLVLMGAVLAVHGLVALAHAFAVSAPKRD